MAQSSYLYITAGSPYGLSRFISGVVFPKTRQSKTQIPWQVNRPHLHKKRVEKRGGYLLLLNPII